MKTNELRIGNWVEQPNDGVTRVTAILNDLQIKTETGYVDKYCRPIPLTEEWLESGNTGASRGHMERDSQHQQFLCGAGHCSGCRPQQNLHCNPVGAGGNKPAIGRGEFRILGSVCL